MIFWDTSGMLAFHRRSESCHAAAITFVRSGDPLLTHDYVLAEFVALANVRRFPRREALDFITELHDNVQVSLVDVDLELRLSAIALLKSRIDKSWSLCDAVSFLLMEQFNVREALTTDHHFEQAGFVRLLSAD